MSRELNHFLSGAIALRAFRAACNLSLAVCNPAAGQRTERSP
jgi:hypothetical protein